MCPILSLPSALRSQPGTMDALGEFLHKVKAGEIILLLKENDQCPALINVLNLCPFTSAKERVEVCM